MNTLEHRLRKLEERLNPPIDWHATCAAVCIVQAGEDTEAKSAAMLARYRAEHDAPADARFPFIVISIGDAPHERPAT
jgi:hypothetical protein